MVGGCFWGVLGCFGGFCSIVFVCGGLCLNVCLWGVCMGMKLCVNKRMVCVNKRKVCVFMLFASL